MRSFFLLWKTEKSPTTVKQCLEYVHALKTGNEINDWIISVYLVFSCGDPNRIHIFVHSETPHNHDNLYVKKKLLLWLFRPTFVPVFLLRKKREPKSWFYISFANSLQNYNVFITLQNYNVFIFLTSNLAFGYWDEERFVYAEFCKFCIWFLYIF